MMTKDEFYKYAENTAKEMLNPDEYEVSFVSVNKATGTYAGLAIRRIGLNGGPVLNLDQMYKEAEKKGGEKAMVVEMVKSVSKERIPRLDGVADFIGDYEKAKSRLFIKVTNGSANHKWLDEVPHTKMCDLVITYHLKMNDVAGMHASTAVTNDLLGKYGVTKEQLHRDAVVNSSKVAPARIFPIMAALGFMGEEPDGSENGLVVVTNDTKVDGAASLFYEGVMDKLAERKGGKIFLLPSSVHEFLALEDDGMADAKDLAEMVKTINLTEVAPEDRLSDHVYHYSKETGEFKIVA